MIPIVARKGSVGSNETRPALAPFIARPRVIVRLGCHVDPAAAVLAGRPGELEGMPPDRYIYRLESREEP